jgi:hypothetical protein
MGTSESPWLKVLATVHELMQKGSPAVLPVGQCRLNPGQIRADRAWIQRL